MRDLLLAFFLLTAFPLVIYRYHIGALVIGFISFMYPQSNTFGFALTTPWLDYFFIVTFGAYFLGQGYKEYKHHPLITMVSILYIWVCLTTYFAISPEIAHTEWLKFTKIMVLAYLVYAMLFTEQRLVAFIKVMVLSFGFYGIKGGLFTIISGGSFYVLGPVNSFYSDNNNTALVLVMTIPFMVFFITHGQNLYQRYFSIFCALCTAVAILGTQSRTGFAALVVTLLYLIWLQKKFFRALLVITPIAAVALFFMPDSWTDRMATTTDTENDQSFQERVDMWEASVRIANDFPVMGGGFDVIYVPQVIIRYIPLETEARAIHSAYFQMIAEHGYVGLMIFLAMMFLIFHYARKMAKECKDIPHLKEWMPDLSYAIRASAAGYLIICYTSNIAFFDLIYFVLVITALANVVLQAQSNLYKSEQIKKLAVET
mgnify:CR=1 FL=1